MTTPYLAVDRGIDALKDAIAAIRCAAVGDAEGFKAVIDHTETGRFTAGQLAVVAAAICHRVGLTGEALAAMLDELQTSGIDAMLDQSRPERGTGEVMTPHA